MDIFMYYLSKGASNPVEINQKGGEKLNVLSKRTPKWTYTGGG